MATQKKPIVEKQAKEITFTWLAKDRKGKEVSGEMKAVSSAVVRVALRSKGLNVVKVKQKSFGMSTKKVQTSEIAVLTRQLATMMKSGVPLIQSFEIVANGHANPAVSKLLYDIKNNVEQGANLADSFARHPEYFDKLYCNLVGAGEKAGILDTILDRLAVYQEKMQKIKKKIKSALTYPIAIMGIATIVTSIIMIFVVPSFKKVFAEFGAELPAPTLIVMNMSDFVVANWYFIFGGAIGIFMFFSNLIKTNAKARENFDRGILKLPIFGIILQKSANARWARTLATMFAAGVPLVEALDSVAGAAGNIIYEKATKQIQKEVTTGQGLTVAMDKAKIFPPMMIQMAQIGEESGSLDDMLNKVAEFYEEEVDTAVDSLASLMEPFIISFLGIVVGGLVVAMYLPIFKMASTV